MSLIDLSDGKPTDTRGEERQRWRQKSKESQWKENQISNNKKLVDNSERNFLEKTDK